MSGRTNHSLNAINGNGSSYNKMDSTTSKGMEASDLAKAIAKAVDERKGQLIVAPFYMKVVLFLQTVCPSVVSWIMQNKAKKEGGKN